MVLKVFQLLIYEHRAWMKLGIKAAWTLTAMLAWIHILEPRTGCGTRDVILELAVLSFTLDKKHPEMTYLTTAAPAASLGLNVHH